MKSFAVSLMFCCSLSVCFAQHKVKIPEIGIASELKYDSTLHAEGYHWLVESIQNCISPLKFSDAEFEKYLAIFAQMKMKIYAVNIFIPGEMKLVGPDVQEQKILDYARQVLARCKKAGIKMIVWGSGGARRVPEGFDHKKATQQFIEIAKKVSVLAKEYSITIALENLNSTETNFINRVEEALAVVQAVNHPNFRLCVDVYHMLKEAEPPAIIGKTKKYLVHCDLAERDNRTPPGVVGDDFRPYLQALYKVGYDKVIVLECRWENIAAQAVPARANLYKQLEEVYNK
ncbi:MAG: sugar phosphate isomerase/epimerase family protein [Chryseolinea sp.]